MLRGTNPREILFNLPIFSKVATISKSYFLVFGSSLVPGCSRVGGLNRFFSTMRAFCSFVLMVSLHSFPCHACWNSISNRISEFSTSCDVRSSAELLLKRFSNIPTQIFSETQRVYYIGLVYLQA